MTYPYTPLFTHPLQSLQPFHFPPSLTHTLILPHGLTDPSRYTHPLTSITRIAPLKPISQILARPHELIVLSARVDAAAREAAAEDAVVGFDAVAGRLGVVGAAVAGAFLRCDGDGADGEEGAEEEGEGCCETHVDGVGRSVLVWVLVWVWERERIRDLLTCLMWDAPLMIDECRSKGISLLYAEACHRIF